MSTIHVLTFDLELHTWVKAKMQSDEVGTELVLYYMVVTYFAYIQVIWGVIKNGFCSFKAK